MKPLRVFLTVCGIATLLRNGYIFSTDASTDQATIAVITTLIWTYLFIKETMENTK